MLVGYAVLPTAAVGATLAAYALHDPTASAARAWLTPLALLAHAVAAALICGTTIWVMLGFYP